MLQLPGLSLRDGGVKEGEMHRQIRIDVGEFCEDLPHPDGDAQLLPALPDQGFLFGLPGSTLPPTNSQRSPRALWAGRWQARNRSPRQISAATTSTAFGIKRSFPGKNAGLSL